jgi:polysaccharide biosynthesis/export protein
MTFMFRFVSGPAAAALFLVLLRVPLLGSAEKEYEVGVSDVLRVAVLGQPELSGEFTVEPDGAVAFPFLGRVKASEMTVKEFEKKLTTLLADGYLKKPQVSASVKEYRSQRILVTGEVLRPGPYALRSDRTLLSLLTDMGSLGPNAGHEVVVTRPPGERVSARLFERDERVGLGRGDDPPTAIPVAQTLRIDLRELQAGNASTEIVLKAGDTVHVPRAAQIYVSGHVARPGPYRYEVGMTVLQVLNLAGGVTERGASGRVKIVRIVDGKKVETRMDVIGAVQPEDLIVVPERFF